MNSLYPFDIGELSKEEFVLGAIKSSGAVIMYILGLALALRLTGNRSSVPAVAVFFVLSIVEIIYILKVL